MNWHIGRVLFLSVGVLALVGGCSSQSKRVKVPGVGVEVSYFAGNALSGALGKSVEDQAVKEAWGVKVRVVGVTVVPKDGFAGVGPMARLVVTDDPESLVAPSSRLVYSTLYRELTDENLAGLLGDEKGWVEVATKEGAVAAGATVKFEGERENNNARLTGRRAIRLLVSRPAGTNDRYEIAILAEDQVAEGKGASGTSTVTEMVLLERKPTGDKDRLALVTPMRFEKSKVAALVIELSVETKPASAEAIAEMKKGLDASAAEATQALAQKPATPDEMMMAFGLEALGQSGDAPRAALVYLAQQSGAKITETVAGVAEEKVLALMVKGMRERMPQLPSRDRGTVAWMLDRVTIGAVGSIRVEEGDPSMNAVEGALAAVAGEVGRQLDLLQSMANEAISSEDLMNRIMAEHIILLEDASPAMRVRAYDWLSARGSAPAGFDPLGDNASRKTALDAYRAAAAN